MTAKGSPLQHHARNAAPASMNLEPTVLWKAEPAGRGTECPRLFRSSFHPTGRLPNPSGLLGTPVGQPAKGLGYGFHPGALAGGVGGSGTPGPARRGGVPEAR